LFSLIFGIIGNAITFSQGNLLPLSPRLRWKLDRFKEKWNSLFGSKPENARPKLCPACGTLVGATATRCHQCGASMTFSLAAASKSLSRLMPTSSPVTYGILTFSCVLYAMSMLWTMRTSGFPPPGGGFFGLGNLGAINGPVLLRLGASLPLGINLAEPWRFVMAVFLHGSLLHIAFNMWILMDIGPVVEELYGSSRYLFIYVVTGIGGYILSSSYGHFSVGGSGAVLGLCGVILAVTMGSKNASSEMLRSYVIRLLVYVAIVGFLPLGSFVGSVDNTAHIGGVATGFLLGKVMMNREPSSPEERKLAYVMGWGAALLVAASVAMMIFMNYKAGV
jgi:membrane associated rhomboid family serine protease